MKKNMLHLLLGVFATFFFTDVKAVSTGEIIGQVIEQETKKPVPFAQVVFENKMDKIVVTANEYGFYYAHHLPTGKYQMRIQYNSRNFYMNKVQVYDSYSSEVNLLVSNNPTLPENVELVFKENTFSALSTHDIKLNNSSFNQPTRSLNDVLSEQPGIDVRDGKLFVKGSDQVRFFIDGTPVMGAPTQNRVW